MTMPDRTGSDRSPAVLRLRLAAALTHQLPQVALTLWPRDGASMVVSRRSRHRPDLSACEFRALVRDRMVDSLTDCDLTDCDLTNCDLTVDGVGVRHVGDGVVAVELGDEAGRWWPTLLDAATLTTVVADAAAGALEDAIVCPALVGASTVAAHVDVELGVTVVQLCTPPGPIEHDRACDALARVLSRACVVAEVLEGAGSGSPA